MFERLVGQNRVGERLYPDIIADIESGRVDPGSGPPQCWNAGGRDRARATTPDGPAWNGARFYIVHLIGVREIKEYVWCYIK